MKENKEIPYYEVANTVKFLTSNEADYITGETIHVNGGMYFS